jgi:hypothetical protein
MSKERQSNLNFQLIVSDGVLDHLLKWKAELVSSNNAKIVVMGNGRNDLPVLLNREEPSVNVA